MILHLFSPDCSKQYWIMGWSLKIGKTQEMFLSANYRPVSLTSITCNLMEHIVQRSLMIHSTNSTSCVITLLIVTIHEIAKHLSCGNQVDVILLNFAKAFDKVTHARLLHKLDFCGIRGSLIFVPLVAGNRVWCLMDAYHENWRSIRRPSRHGPGPTPVPGFHQRPARMGEALRHTPLCRRFPPFPPDQESTGC